MFSIGLGELDRAGRLRFREDIPADDPLWEGAEFRLLSEVSVDLEATRASSGQIVARGTLSTRVGGGCRRCLAPVELDIEQQLGFVWSDPDAPLEEQDESGELRTLEPDAAELDIGEALREELFLSAPRYLVCRADCKGICPECGVNWNDESCECGGKGIDPRWDALRSTMGNESVG